MFALNKKTVKRVSFFLLSVLFIFNINVFSALAADNDLVLKLQSHSWTITSGSAGTIQYLTYAGESGEVDTSQYVTTKTLSSTPDLNTVYLSPGDTLKYSATYKLTVNRTTVAQLNIKAPDSIFSLVTDGTNEAFDEAFLAAITDETASFVIKEDGQNATEVINIGDIKSLSYVLTAGKTFTISLTASFTFPLDFEYNEAANETGSFRKEVGGGDNSARTASVLGILNEYMLWVDIEDEIIDNKLALTGGQWFIIFLVLIALISIILAVYFYILSKKNKKEENNLAEDGETSLSAV